MLIDAADAENYLRDADLITGDPGGLNKARERSHARQSTITVDLFLAEGVGRLGLERKRTWRSGDFLTADPLYIRPPDAVKNRRKKNAMKADES